MNRKLRILFIGEASWLATGYATYNREILTRLAQTEKYELAELGCFATTQQASQQGNIPWRFYGNMPEPGDKAGIEKYNSNSMNAFGAWRFEEVLLDFKADAVVDVRDIYMCSFEATSPFRPYYQLSLMPTIDATPQQAEWLSFYMSADAIFSYSDWGLSILNESKGLIKTIGTASPGADLKTFAPVNNKQEHKTRYSLPADSFVIGTVMRNQKRKLFPELMKSFRLFLDQAPLQISQKSYLYMHTSFPDHFNIPTLMLEHGISHRCFFTYKCKACNYTFTSRWQDARGVCSRCNKGEAFLPNTHLGVSREELAVINNLFDVYIQYATNESQGMPQVEAAACGIPVFSVDYSAMSDVVRKLKGYSINVLKLVRDGDIGTDKAIPDNQDLVDKLMKFAQLPESLRKKKGFEARVATEKHYDWDKTAKVWENYFDSVPLRDHSLTWESPLKQHEVLREVPPNMSPDDFISWAITNVMGKPELVNHYMAVRLLRDVQWKSQVENLGSVEFNEMSNIGIKAKRKDFTREHALEELKAIADNYNYWEQRRWNKVQIQKK